MCEKKDAFIRLENYTKTIRGKTVLQGLNLRFAAGKTYRIQGVNGSGKTMLLRAIAGLIYPTDGSICVNGSVLRVKEEYPVKVGALIEQPQYWKQYTGFEMLKYFADLRREISVDEICRQMQRMRLAPDDDRKIAKYSLGMRQKLGIIQAYMERPDILLLDEPVNALDSEAIQCLAHVITEEKERGAVVIVAIHNCGEFDLQFDGFVELENGMVKKYENVN